MRRGRELGFRIDANASNILTASAGKSELEALAFILKPKSLHLLIYSVFFVYCFISRLNILSILVEPKYLKMPNK